MNIKSYWTAKLNWDNTVPILLEQAVDNHSATWDFILITKFFIYTPAGCSFGYINGSYTQPLQTLKSVPEYVTSRQKGVGLDTSSSKCVPLPQKCIRSPYNQDCWPLTLKTFSAMATYVINICAKFHLNLSTKCRDIDDVKKVLMHGQMDN